jgi:hypothetical protein
MEMCLLEYNDSWVGSAGGCGVDSQEFSPGIGKNFFPPSMSVTALGLLLRIGYWMFFFLSQVVAL